MQHNALPRVLPYSWHWQKLITFFALPVEGSKKGTKDAGPGHPILPTAPDYLNTSSHVWQHCQGCSFLWMKSIYLHLYTFTKYSRIYLSHQWCISIWVVKGKYSFSTQQICKSEKNFPLLTWQSVPPTWAPLKFHSIIIIILWTERMLSSAAPVNLANQFPSILFWSQFRPRPRVLSAATNIVLGQEGRENMLPETDLQTRTVTEDVVVDRWRLHNLSI